MKIILIAIAMLMNTIYANSRILFVGENETYTSIDAAADQAIPGDTIFVSDGIYSGGMYIENLQGDESNQILITGSELGNAIIRGGNNAIQFSDPKHLILENLIFEGQTVNGLNIDDGGDYATPASNVIIRNCIFRDMNASGNNDLLKLSGLDNFIIENCTFENGAAGGSGLDMVGCHYGIIRSCKFSELGSNAIQAKGGTSQIEISANYFENCGQRTLNLGGSTGLEYFRPIDATTEAADLQVYSNIIIGSLASIAYVGSVNVEVINNTIINPEKWVIRILQETVDEERFERCGHNTFANNLIYLGNISTETNIGPDTAPESFSFDNNFWYNHENDNWQGPYIPVTDENLIINLSPEFEDISDGNYNLTENSPAIGIINYTGEPLYDYYGNVFNQPRSAGAIEYNNSTSIDDNINITGTIIYPNPASEYIEINLAYSPSSQEGAGVVQEIKIYNIFGKLVLSDILHLGDVGQFKRIDISNLPVGIYFIHIGNYSEKIVVVQ